MSSQIQEVKQASDIIQVIGERVELKRSGSNFRGLCPFHSEKSPSFFVSEVLQRYKCFGCGESGDAFTFLEKYEGMTFSEALRTLADQAGITLKEVHRT
ncbi:MAG TPA: CHC2 zinc finger domain-containing protein, partial [Patescibacteria group bacterium]